MSRANYSTPPSDPKCGRTWQQRALAVREDYRAEQQRVQQYRAEQRAAERLRIPEPVDQCRPETRRCRAAQNRERARRRRLDPASRFQQRPGGGRAIFGRAGTRAARLQILSQQIRAAVEGNVRAFNVRSAARDDTGGRSPTPARNSSGSRPSPIRKARSDILQLLDAYRLQRQAQLRMLDIQAAVKEAQIELERVVGEEFGK